MCGWQALKEKQTLEQQLRLDRRERQNTQLAAKNMHAKAQAELDQSRAEIERRTADVETTVCHLCNISQKCLESDVHSCCVLRCAMQCWCWPRAGLVQS